MFVVLKTCLRLFERANFVDERKRRIEKLERTKIAHISAKIEFHTALIADAVW